MTWGPHTQGKRDSSFYWMCSWVVKVDEIANKFSDLLERLNFLRYVHSVLRIEKKFSVIALS